MSGHTFHQRRAYSMFAWAIVYAALWALLSQNQGWGFGVLFIALALLCTWQTGLTAPTVSLRHVPAFLLYFLRKLVAGGVDVALRTLGRTPRVDPCWVDYQCQTERTDIQLYLSAIVGLLPGTLAARVENGTMRIHLLDQQQSWQADITALEQHLIRIMSTQDSTI